MHSIANMDIGSGFTGVGIGLHLQGMKIVDGDDFVDVGAEAQNLFPPRPPGEQLDGEEGNVLDLDPPHLRRRDHPINALGIPGQGRREKADHFLSLYGRTPIVPDTIPVDENVEITAQIAIRHVFGEIRTPWRRLGDVGGVFFIDHPGWRT